MNELFYNEFLGSAAVLCPAEPAPPALHDPDGQGRQHEPHSNPDWNLLPGTVLSASKRHHAGLHWSLTLPNR